MKDELFDVCKVYHALQNIFISNDDFRLFANILKKTW